MICKECGNKFGNKELRKHLKEHGFSLKSYRQKFRLEFCQKCGEKLQEKNISGICLKCRDWTGENNPFWGKSHSKDTLELIRSKTKVASENLWKKGEYREKIKQTTNGLKRDEKFREKQKQNALNWYKEHPEQKNLRSERMMKTWKDGKIEPNINSINESKMEKLLFKMIKTAIPQREVKKKTIKIEGRWFYPDIMIDNKVIIEFFGDYWHGNPQKYKNTDMIHHKMTAGEIWEKDAERIDILKNSGYTIIVVWQKDFLQDKEGTVRRIIESL